MLTELRIVNFALIERLHIQFESGFTALTGETGAGKSLLIDAIALLVGGRASTDQIRSGEEEAQLEAAFHLPEKHPLLQRLRQDEVVGLQERDLVLKRVLSRSGRHRVYVNGSLCPLRVLESMAGTLVDIHGQHEQQSLLVPASQLEAVDSFGSLEPLRDRYEAAYREWKDAAARLQSAAQIGTEQRRLEELMRFQLQEIEAAGLKVDEEASLLAERQRLVHADRLREWAEHAYAELHAEEHGVLQRLGRMARELMELGETDGSMEDCEQQVRTAAIQLKDLGARLRDYADALDADGERRVRVEDRLDVIQRLKKKYGGSIEAALATGARVKEEVSAIETFGDRIADLTKQVEAAKRRVVDVAKQLSKKRREATERLQKLVGAELAAVKMMHTSFDVALSTVDVPEMFSPAGSDRVEFALSSNVGEPLRPLSRIASGGELSRIMLALKSVLADRDRVPVLVFDEIDTGVGGAVAAAMGTRLRRLGEYHQVFCITHLPQVASQAQHHLLVEKKEANGRTITTVKPLDGMRREEEIARMLGGVTITKKVRDTAAELIQGAGRKT